MRSRALAIASTSTGHITGSLTRSRVSGIVGSLHIDMHIALLVVRYQHAPRTAAHLAVLDVLLRGAAAGVECDLVFLAAVGAHHGGFRFRCAVTEGEILFGIVVWVVAVLAHHARCNRLAL